MQCYFTSKEVVRITGVSYRRLDYWIRKGIINSSGRKALGKGSNRLFTFKDLIEVRVVAALTAYGLKPSYLKSCIRNLRKTLPKDSDKSFSTSRFLTDGRKLFRAFSEGQQLESLDDFGQFMFAFGVNEEIQRVVTNAKDVNPRLRYSNVTATENIKLRNKIQKIS